MITYCEIKGGFKISFSYKSIECQQNLLKYTLIMISWFKYGLFEAYMSNQGVSMEISRIFLSPFKLRIQPDTAVEGQRQSSNINIK